MTDDFDMQVGLRLVDADALLACVEWALNREELNLGPGIHPRNVEEAARRIESVADMARREIR
jgi:hypothetical protein